MKRVLVTGGSGFIGQALIKRLKKKGCQVFELNQDKGKDILDKKNFESFKKIDTVFHLAALVGYANVEKNLTLAYQTNVLGTVNVLEFCRQKNAKLVFPSTFVYGPPFSKSKKETDQLAPTNFYTHSKYLAELFCQLYAQRYKVDVVIARASNAYGPRQPDHYIIPLLIKNLKRKKRLTLYHPQAKRDFIFIDDLVAGFIKLAKSNTKPGEVFNVSFGKTASLRQLVNLVKKATASKTKITFEKKLRTNEVLQSLMDNSKIKKKACWKPKISLKEGLRKLL